MQFAASACRGLCPTLATCADTKENPVSQSAPQVFNGVTPEQYARLVEKAEEAGIDLTGPSGTASKFGVEVAWNYAADAHQLTLHCLKTPFFMSTKDVDAKIQTLVKESLA
jgi:hypothetical protein